MLDTYGHEAREGMDCVYASKGGLKMLRIAEVHPDKIVGIALGGRRTTIRGDFALAFGWDFQPVKTKRRGRL